MKYLLTILSLAFLFGCGDDPKSSTGPEVSQETPSPVDSANIFIRTSAKQSGMVGYTKFQMVNSTSVKTIYMPNYVNDTVDLYYWVNGYTIARHRVNSILNFSDTDYSFREGCDFWTCTLQDGSPCPNFWPCDTSWTVWNGKCLSPRGDSAYCNHKTIGIAKIGSIPFDSANPYAIITKYLQSAPVVETTFTIEIHKGLNYIDRF